MGFNFVFNYHFDSFQCQLLFGKEALRHDQVGKQDNYTRNLFKCYKLPALSEYCYKYGLQVPRYLQSLETIQVTGTLHQLKTSQLICQKLKEFRLQLVPFQFQTLKQLYVSNVAHLDLISRCFKDQAFKCSKTVALISQHKDPMDLPNSLMLAKVQLQYLLTRQSLS